MSFHYWRNLGQTQKTKFITLENSYHGETLGALAVGNVALYKDTYAPLLMDVITVAARIVTIAKTAKVGRPIPPAVLPPWSKLWRNMLMRYVR
jgi:Adenosylmethionine-8-amino-7-oxononanoate aminotransferase